MHLIKTIYIFTLLSLLLPSISSAGIKTQKGHLVVLNGYQSYFQKYSRQYHLIIWDDNLTILQQAVAPNKKSIDLLLSSARIADLACNNGLLLGTLDDLLLFKNRKCITKTFLDHTGIAWDVKKIHFNPSWNDFWNITQYPGKRGMQKDAFSALSIALMADGVSATNVTQELSTPSGILRAFKKLNQLRPYIVWWSTPQDANFLLLKNQVLMTSASLLSLNAFKKQYPSSHFEFQYQNTIESPIVLSIPMTIQTQQIHKVQNLLQKHSSKLFPLETTHYKELETNIKPIIYRSLQYPISLDDIFDKWLMLKK